MVFSPIIFIIGFALSPLGEYTLANFKCAN